MSARAASTPARGYPARVVRRWGAGQRLCPGATVETAPSRTGRSPRCREEESRSTSCSALTPGSRATCCSGLRAFARQPSWDRSRARPAESAISDGADASADSAHSCSCTSADDTQRRGSFRAPGRSSSARAFHRPPAIRIATRSCSSNWRSAFRAIERTVREARRREGSVTLKQQTTLAKGREHPARALGLTGTGARGTCRGPDPARNP
jgi:hypothetical protein